MKPAICLKGLRVSQGTNFELSIDSLELLPRRIYALTGPNGAGKSTLLKTMALLQTPQAGEVSFPATQVASRPHKRQQVTLVEQSPYMLTGTVSANLAFGLKLRGIRGQERQQRISSALEMVGLSGFEQRRADKLSGGEMQRVALARALVLQPDVLLLDEPTSNIDSKSLQSFEELLSSLPEQGVTVVFSTHDLSQPERLGGEMIRIEEGRLLDKPHHAMEDKNLTQTEKKLWLNPLKAQGL